MIFFVTAMAMPKTAWAQSYDTNGFGVDGANQPAVKTTDKYENRRHVHVFPRLKGSRGKYSVAKIWLESHGQKQVEIYESSLSSKENDLLLRIIDDNW